MLNQRWSNVFIDLDAVYQYAVELIVQTYDEHTHARIQDSTYF